MLLFLLCVFFKKNETSRPPPAPASDNYDKTSKRHLQMAPRITQTILSSPLLALFVLLGFRLGIRARVVITHEMKRHQKRNVIVCF